MKVVVMSSRINARNIRRWRFALLGVAFALFVGGTWAPLPAGQERPFPAGPGKEETLKLCSGCHELERAFSVHQDRAGWQQTVDKMVAFGMKGTEKEISAALEYLVEHYTADDVPKIKVNKATAIELESGLSLRRSQAATIIQYRNKHGNFKTLKDLKKIPGIDAAKIDAKKDRLIF